MGEKIEEKNVEINDLNFLNEYDELIEDIIESVIQSGGKKLDTEFKAKAPPPAIWWDNKCKKEVDNRRKKIKNLLEDFNKKNFEEYEEACKSTKKIILQKKKKNFIEFCGSLNPEMSVDKIWGYIKAFKSRKLTNTTRNINSPDDPKIKETIEKIAPNVETPEIKIKDNNNSDEKLEQKIHINEVQMAIKKSKTHSAPGKDMISYRIIKEFPKNAVKKLTDIYNCILNTGRSPQCWKEQFVCLIPKPNDRGFRPISLSSCMQKFLERIVNDRIQWSLESKFYFPKQFFGFL